MSSERNIRLRYLILLEPGYEFATDEGKARMKKHGYITRLHSTALKLGYKVVEHRPFDYASNPLNPTGLILIEKASSASNSSKRVCPLSRTDLVEVNGTLLYSRESFLAYPIIDGIPCLIKENAILATHLLTNYKEFKKTNNIEFEQ